MSHTTVLIIEDDKILNNYLCDLLKNAGYCTESCFDGIDALEKAQAGQYQLILLDKMLPNLDGVSVLKKIRETSDTPVIMVSAKGAEEERILGLKHGADDYVTKPFNSQELLLRIESLLRRTHGPIPSTFLSEVCIAGLTMNQGKQSISVHGKMLDFTPIQFKLLWQLISNKNEIISKAQLYESVLNKKLEAYDRSLDMHLSRVRRKLNEANWQGERLQTVHGKGYCFK